MYNMAVQIDDRETRPWCPFCSYVLSETCRICRWLIHYSVCTAYRDVRQIAKPGLQRSQLKQRLTVFAKIVEFPWAHLYPKGE